MYHLKQSMCWVSKMKQFWSSSKIGWLSHHFWCQKWRTNAAPQTEHVLGCQNEAILEQHKNGEQLQNGLINAPQPALNSSASNRVWVQLVKQIMFWIGTMQHMKQRLAWNPGKGLELRWIQPGFHLSSRQSWAGKGLYTSICEATFDGWVWRLLAAGKLKWSRLPPKYEAGSQRQETACQTAFQFWSRELGTGTYLSWTRCPAAFHS